MKTIISIVGIRPDFIRMSEIFKKLDKYFHHILIHTGQHFDPNLSDIFFQELGIRKPDFNLGIGSVGKEHFEQTAELSVKIIKLIREKNLNPDLILFLGDSNSVVASVALKKEGFKIGHIEAGMRSGDKHMLEEINRTVCDHCSDILFTYHRHYKVKLNRENIKNVFVVGNTIVEVCKPIANILSRHPKILNKILLDIHRPENFKYEDRLRWIIDYANQCSQKYNVRVEMLSYHRTNEYLKKFNIGLGSISQIPCMGYREYLEYIYNCPFIISDSGTAQEEAALFNTKAIVPRDFTERPESMDNYCSFLLYKHNFEGSFEWLLKAGDMRLHWLGAGHTSTKIIKILQNYLL